MKKRLIKMGAVTLTAIALESCSSIGGRNPFLNYLFPENYVYEKKASSTIESVQEKELLNTNTIMETIIDPTIRKSSPEPSEKYEPPAYKLEREKEVKTETLLKMPSKKPLIEKEGCLSLDELEELKIDKNAIKGKKGLAISCLWEIIPGYKEKIPLEHFKRAFVAVNYTEKFGLGLTLKDGEIYTLLKVDF